jgi:hypothetical protein
MTGKQEAMEALNVKLAEERKKGAQGKIGHLSCYYSIKFINYR